ncbi:tellurite resistance TerB family protein [Calothrix sp. FACHB-1219]|uniref:tellurite resistance TerB family protein n=1 Tax=unclassified Calothrix TaxID=2619626 RepID=UPI00168896EE|nr:MULTISPECIES: tellurite resistance TerB family protein [unclassified Calothrix]MBD2203662.1 tellurite resistance TerB family protein [Calothrix sp. FACHB-168]MBD2219968.1 tellurite resistance TerB family protein [Calothrix sp. FACHB-1219]
MFQRKFPNRGSNSSVVLEPEVAIAVIGLFSAASDDEGVSRTEEFALSEMLAGISQFEDFSDKDFDQLTEKVYDLLEEENPEEVIELAIASLPDEEYREAAYITALLVVGIDGEVPEGEQEYVSELQDALNISNRRAQQIIDHIFGEDDDEEYDYED